MLDHENHASGAGIRTAGFVGRPASFDPTGRPAVMSCATDSDAAASTCDYQRLEVACAAEGFEKIVFGLAGY